MSMTLLRGTTVGLVAVVAASVLMPLSGAAAAKWQTRSSVSDLLLAGSRVVWTEGRRDGGFNLYYGAGRAERRVQSFHEAVPNDANAVFLIPQLAASGDELLLRATKLTIEKNPQENIVPPKSRLFEGPLGSKLRETARCEHPLHPGRGGLAATDAVVAVSDCDGAVEIRERTGESSYVVGSNVDQVQAAGSYVAWLEGPEHGSGVPDAIVVFDRATRSIAYKVDAAAAPPSVSTFTLDRDGTVAFSFDPDPPRRPC
jgi:hypothetical protein